MVGLVIFSHIISVDKRQLVVEVQAAKELSGLSKLIICQGQTLYTHKSDTLTTTQCQLCTIRCHWQRAGPAADKE